MKKVKSSDHLKVLVNNTAEKLKVNKIKSPDRNRIKRNLIDRLLDDENRGNIVEMIFYASSFDLCKS